MIRNAGLAFSRGLTVDGYLGLVCAIPAIGSLFAPIKFINAGVLKVAGKFKTWAMAVIDGLKHPKLLGKRNLNHPRCMLLLYLSIHRRH